MLISSAQHAKYFSGNLQLKCRGEVRSPDRQSTVRTANQQPTTNSWFLVRHRRPTAHARARYRCFLPDLAGLAGRRRAGPMPDNSILASGSRKHWSGRIVRPLGFARGKLKSVVRKSCGSSRARAPAPHEHHRSQGVNECRPFGRVADQMRISSGACGRR